MTTTFAPAAGQLQVGQFYEPELIGRARSEWEHSIPPVGAPRYSTAFGDLREG